jgi:hypothetical protein
MAIGHQAKTEILVDMDIRPRHQTSETEERNVNMFRLLLISMRVVPNVRLSKGA